MTLLILASQCGGLEISTKANAKIICYRRFAREAQGWPIKDEQRSYHLLITFILKVTNHVTYK